jgi:hypothetical protein
VYGGCFLDVVGFGCFSEWQHTVNPRRERTGCEVATDRFSTDPLLLGGRSKHHQAQERTGL